jgi:hypothetical protein
VLKDEVATQAWTSSQDEVASQAEETSQVKASQHKNSEIFQGDLGPEDPKPHINR